MELENAQNWIGALVFLVILAAIGVLILHELQTTMKSTTSIENETFTSFTAGTPKTLVSGSDDFPADLSIDRIQNATSGALYLENNTNFVVNSTYGELVILATIISEEGNNVEVVATTDFNVSYTYSHGNTKTDVITNSTLGITNVTDQLPTVGIIVGVLLIIGAVVLIALYFGRKDYV